MLVMETTYCTNRVSGNNEAQKDNSILINVTKWRQLSVGPYGFFLVRGPIQ